MDAQTEDGSEQERVAGGPEKRAVTIQFDDQRHGAVGRDVQFVPRGAVQDDAQIGPRKRESQRRDAAVGQDRAVRRARTATASFESRFPGKRAGEAQANLAVRACRQQRLGKRRGRGVVVRVRKQIHLQGMLLKRGGQRLPAGRGVCGQGTGMGVDTDDGDKQMRGAFCILNMRERARFRMDWNWRLREIEVATLFRLEAQLEARVAERGRAGQARP